MNQVVTNSGAAAQYYDVAKTMQNKKAAKAENNAAPAKKSSSTAADKTNTYDNLSTKAKALLDELKDKYTNMDFLWQILAVMRKHSRSCLQGLKIFRRCLPAMNWKRWQTMRATSRKGST